ncbi:hypothetical protein [Streptomyces sp. NPDC048442]|uniref:hypothetical protein n=1 Tax=Streptomyces sp. NPDC048442 TaxID=3154823 RepID=UPI00341C302F
MDITAPRTAKVGGTFVVEAHGNDDAAGYLRVCLESRSSEKAWHQVTCGAVVDIYGGEAQVAAHVRAEHRGVQECRALVYGLTSPNDKHPVRQRTSAPVKVNVR